jgi:EAL domain-containing protein (putative c-di-GMP-specific phosphodiesterase class I)
MRQGHEPFRLSVNISAVQFHSGALIDTVVTILSETGMDPANLCLELTEGIVMKDIDETITSLKKLESLGISLSIDDFGTGYSSLSYLLRMPIDEIKIDRSFVNGLPDQKEHLAVINAIITMASAMNFRVVAEGVETEEQLGCLTEVGCHTVQGYYFSRPLPVDQLELEFLMRDFKFPVSTREY